MGEKSRELDFSKAYPVLPEEKLAVIQLCYDTKAKTFKSESSIERYQLTFNIVCTVLSKNKYIPFNKWDADILTEFIKKTELRGTYLSTGISIMKECLSIAGCSNDLSSVTASVIASEYSSELLSFEIMNNILKKTFQKERPLYTWGAVNSWTTGIVIAYLSWLGFTRDEIGKLQRSDYNEKTSTITYCGKDYVKNRDIADRTDRLTAEYIRRYFISDTYEVYSEIHGWRNIPYLKCETFIKMTSSENEAIKDAFENYARKMRRNFGFGTPDILTAGRMDRMYYLNKVKNIPITFKSAEEISVDLDIPLTKRVRQGTELGDLILMYDSYKTKREAIYSNV